MIRSLWIAKTGMDVQQTNIDVISHNLANISTNGYKHARPVFEDLIYQTIRQAGSPAAQQGQIPTGLQLGVGARTVATVRIYTEGALQNTNNSFDMAISGQGFFRVLSPDGQTTGYTRDGSFRLDSQGRLVMSNGWQLQPQFQIPTDAINFTVASDGTASYLPAGGVNPVQLGRITVTTFVNPAGLTAKGENLYLETEASGAPQETDPGSNGAGTLYQGYIEASNVNATEELVNMIQAQRAYELNSRAIQTSDQMLQKLTQL